MEFNRTKKVLAIIFIASIAVIIGTISYAFFAINTSDNKNQSLVLEAGTMQLRFADNDNGVNAQLNFGESISKDFIIENTGTLPATAKINFTSMINTYLKDSLTYRLLYKTDESATEYSEIQSSRRIFRSEAPTTLNLASGLEIPVGAKYYYRLEVTLENLPDVEQTSDLSAIFTTQFNLEDDARANRGWLQDAVVAVYNKKTPNDVNSGTPNFAKTATTDEGVYSMADDYGMSYYFRGASENNYIKYGKNKSGQDMYWRVVRVNGDGSVRIIYDGLEAYANGTNDAARYAITSQPWNVQCTDAKYVGWMFGGAQGVVSTSKEQAQTNETNSDAKVAVDNWYKENIVDTGYADNVTDVLFCNDRTTPGKEITGYASDTGLGYAKNATAYGATARLGVWNSATVATQPKFTCEVKNDAFTVNETDKGNGALTYPVGLITADEIAAGGGKYGTTNQSYYLYKSSTYYGWSFSPNCTSFSGNSSMFSVSTNGNLGSSDSVNKVSGALAPVINLSADYASELIGDGSMKNPYRAE